MTTSSDSGGERIQKVLSRAGVASRREAERLIVAGRVKVNGRVVTELGTRVESGDELRVDDALVDPEPELRYVLYNKPSGVLTTMDDPEGRPTVFEALPDQFGRLYPVGRLDWSSEGLLLLTNDGELANHMMHPRYGVERIYEVKVKGRLSGSDPRLDQMVYGVDIGGGEQGRVKRVESIGSTGKNTWLRMAMTEGKNREVRRLCEALGLSVVRLKRVGYGPLVLADLRVGEFRELTAHEARQLTAFATRKPRSRRRKPRSGSKRAKRPPPGASGKRSGPGSGRPRRRGPKPGSGKRKDNK